MNNSLADIISATEEVNAFLLAYVSICQLDYCTRKVTEECWYAVGNKQVSRLSEKVRIWIREILFGHLVNIFRVCYYM